MLLQDTFPSFGFMVKGGEHGYEPATTLWELWDSDTGNVGMDSRSCRGSLFRCQGGASGVGGMFRTGHDLGARYNAIVCTL